VVKIAEMKFSCGRLKTGHSVGGEALVTRDDSETITINEMWSHNATIGPKTLAKIPKSGVKLNSE
jgi:hypothetical protein